MADTGFKNPTGTGDNWNTWSYPTDAYTSDNAYASTVGSQYQDYYNFDFGLSSCNILGIEVQLEAYFGGDTGSLIYSRISWNGGTNWTDTKSCVVSTGEQYRTLGGSTDIWNRTWSSSEFSNANFRICFYHNLDSNLYVDHIRIKVYYTETTTSTSSSTSTSTSSSSISTSSTSSSSSSMSSTSISTSTSSVSTSSSSVSTSSSSISSSSVRYIPEILEVNQYY